MGEDKRLAAVAAAMAGSNADEVVEKLAITLRELYAAEHVNVYLADYQHVELLPVLGAEPLPASTGSAGRCFAEQAPVLDGSQAVFLPVSFRGERLGVLRVRWDHDPAPDEYAGLAELGRLVADAIVVAAVATDRYEMVRRRRPLTLAAEMQWELLPARGLVRDEISVAGQLEPAYAVRGDTFDWSVDEDRLNLSVSNGMGEGMDAALLTFLGVSALRNARRSGLELREQASLADQAVHARYRGDCYLSSVMMDLELNTGRLTMLDAGSPAVLLHRGDDVVPMALDKQLPLGMFGDSHYTVQEFTLDPGDRLYIISDGVVEAAVEGGTYGLTWLERAIRRARLLSAADGVRTVISDLLSRAPDSRLEDDAVVVCVGYVGREK